jgi:hypothetical protein
MVEELIEALLNVCDALRIGRGEHAVIPFNALLKRGIAQVRATDQGGGGAIGKVEEVAFGVKADLERLEDPELDLAGEIGEPKQSLWLSDIEVIAGKESEFATTIEQIAQVFDHEIQATRPYEGHTQVGSDRTVEMSPKVG